MKLQSLLVRLASISMLCICVHSFQPPSMHSSLPRTNGCQGLSPSRLNLSSSPSEDSDPEDPEDSMKKEWEEAFEELKKRQDKKMATLKYVGEDMVLWNEMYEELVRFANRYKKEGSTNIGIRLVYWPKRLERRLKWLKKQRQLYRDGNLQVAAPMEGVGVDSDLWNKKYDELVRYQNEESNEDWG